MPKDNFKVKIGGGDERNICNGCARFLDLAQEYKNDEAWLEDDSI